MRLPQDYRSLARILKSWSIAPVPDPSFSAKVWRRIKSGEGVKSLSAYLRSNSVLVILALVLAIALGAIGGWSEAERMSNSDKTDIAGAYVHSLDVRWQKAR